MFFCVLNGEVVEILAERRSTLGLTVTPSIPRSTKYSVYRRYVPIKALGKGIILENSVSRCKLLTNQKDLWYKCKKNISLCEATISGSGYGMGFCRPFCMVNGLYSLCEATTSGSG